MPDNLFILALIALFSVLLVIREAMAYMERKEMLNRLMSKDYVEFKSFEKPEENTYTPDTQDDSIPLDEAKDKLLGEDNDDENQF